MEKIAQLLLAVLLVSPAFAAGGTETGKKHKSYGTDVSSASATSSYGMEESSSTLKSGIRKSKDGPGDSKSDTDSSTDSKQQNQ